MTKGWVLSEDKRDVRFQTLTDESMNGKLTYPVLASALNHRDLWITKGKYPGIKSEIVLGSDGCVLHDGSHYILNPSNKWGDNEQVQSAEYTVLGMPHNGTFAHQIVIDSDRLVAKPSHLDVYQAAALPLSGVTAYRALVVKCKPTQGEKVLISGIGGGVALFAFQFALALGCEVYVTSSSDHKIERAIALGARGGYNYSEVDWYKSLIKDIDGVDIVIDSAGGDSFNDLVKVTNPGGRIAFYGGTHGLINGLNPQTLFWRQISLFGSTMGSDADFKAMIELVNMHKLCPIIDEVLPLTELKLGLEKMNQKGQFGKIVFDHSR